LEKQALMQIISCDSYQEMSQKAADLVEEELLKNPELLLCAATGNSPAGLYKELGERAQKKQDIFDRLRVIKLDEWGGIPEKHPVSCEYYLRTKLLEPLGISEARYLSFSSNPEDPHAECHAFRSRLKKEGPIDLCILGLGKNGHLGLNEPAEELEPECHVAKLSDDSLEHEMIASLGVKPAFGMTLGMQEILSSKNILLLLTGDGKKEVYDGLMEGKITTKLPASYLWAHSNAMCLVDRTCLD
jgi:galactosamine-6-phosphate isomerase